MDKLLLLKLYQISKPVLAKTRENIYYCRLLARLLSRIKMLQAGDPIGMVIDVEQCKDTYIGDDLPDVYDEGTTVAIVADYGAYYDNMLPNILDQFRRSVADWEEKELLKQYCCKEMCMYIDSIVDIIEKGDK